MTDPRIVVVNSEIAQTGVAVEDYQTLLILDCNHTTLDRVKVYADGGYDDVLIGSPLRNALDAAFSQSRKPSIVKVGRVKGDSVYAPTSDLLSNEYGFTITLSDGTISPVSHSVLGGDSVEDVVTAIKADMDSDTELAGKIVSSVIGTGALATLSIAAIDSDIDFTLSEFDGDYNIEGVGSEAPQATLTEVSDIDDGYSFVASTNHDVSYQLALGQAVLSANKKKHFGASSLAENYEDWDGISQPSINALTHFARFNNLSRSNIFYHQDADTMYPEIRRYAKFVLLEPGASDFQKKTLDGMPIALTADRKRKLNTAELLNLSKSYASTVVRFGGNDVVGGYQGLGNRMANGIRIESVYWTDRASQVVNALIASYMLNKNKVGLNNGDINAIVSKIDKWLTSQATTLAQTFALDPRRPFRIDVPDASEISFEDKTRGVLTGLTITAFADASLDSVVAELTLTFNDSEG